MACYSNKWMWTIDGKAAKRGETIGKCEKCGGNIDVDGKTTEEDNCLDSLVICDKYGWQPCMDAC